MNREHFTQQESWHGSFYELAIELQTSHDNFRLEKALETLWRHPQLSGRWSDPNNFGQPPEVLMVSDTSDSSEQYSFMRFYGLLSLLEIGKQVGCLSIIVREVDGSDWLDICVPIGMMETLYSVLNPLSTDESPWETVLDKYFLEMADMVYEHVPYDLALIGNEVSGLVNKAGILSDGIENQINAYDLAKNKVLISPSFWNEISVDKAYEVLPSGLRWVTFAQ